MQRDSRAGKPLFFILNTTAFILLTIILYLAGRDTIQQRIGYFRDFGRYSAHAVGFLKKILLLISGSVLLALTSCKIFRIKPQEGKKSRSALLLSGGILFCIALFFLFLKEWALNRFPMDETDIVYYTLTNVRGGGIDKSIVSEVILNFVKSALVTAAFYLTAFIYQKQTALYSFSFKILGKEKRFNTNCLYFAYGLIALCITPFSLYTDLYVGNYIELYKADHGEAIDSEFYREEYYDPALVSVSFPAQKKNLIVILMESMESSFAGTQDGGLFDESLIPNLTRIASDNVNFSDTTLTGGGIDVAGTGWTIAAMTAKFSGLPYKIPGATNAYHRVFLPNATTLTDILHGNGYTQRFIFGSDKNFAGRSTLLEAHGNVEIHDIAWYKEHGMLPQDYSVFWGFEDRKLYAYAKQELEQLSALGGPFMFGLLTVDTHTPGGYVCDICPDGGEAQMHNVIRCADSQVQDFLDWCARQEWYDDTVIVIMGDHLFMANGERDFFPDSLSVIGAQRRWLDIFIHAQCTASDGATQNRTFSSLDMFPTVLAALGCTIENDRLGFGTNLFSGKETLLERYGAEHVNAELSKTTLQYLQLVLPNQ